MARKKQNDIISPSRREFLGRLGLAGMAAALTACGSRRNELGEDDASAQVDLKPGNMTYRTCPTSGDKVSLLGYGCMRWPTVPDSDGTIDQEEVNRLVDKAMEFGINYYDTSPVYCQGFSEKATGIALSRHPRDKYFVATKLSNFSPSLWSREKSMEMYENSFKELQVDHIDYYLLHAIGGGEDAMATFNGRYIDNGMLDFLMEERKKGKIRNLGFSYHGDVRVFDYLLSHHDKYHWDFVQIQLNYLDWNHAAEMNKRNTDAEYLYGELAKLGIPAVIMEPLLGGRLAKVPDHIVTRLKKRAPQNSVASWAFRFAGTPEGILTVLSGMTCMEHLDDNLRSFSPLKPLTDDDNRFLFDTADLMLQYPTIPCNDCQYCMPCPYGLNIPAIMLHYNKCLNEGNVPSGKQSPDYARARRAFLVGYDRAIPSGRQAAHCINCNQCSVHCPQGIDIPMEMNRIADFVEQLKQNA